MKKQSFLTSLAFCTVVGLGLFAGATKAHAADLPNYNKLYTDSRASAQTKVDASLASGKQPTTTTSNSPTNTSSPSTPADANVIVLNTGDHAQVDTSKTQSTNTTVTNNNDATVNQVATGSANTGGNTADRNISYGGNAGDIQTGNAAVNTGLSTDVNHNTTNISNVCPDLTSNVTVYNTGNDLSHTSATSNTCSTSVTNNNKATINQVANSNASTGNNQAERNISFGGSAGQILTGNANVGTVMVTHGNENTTIVGGQSNHGTAGSGANVYIVNTGDGAYLLDPPNSSTNTTVTNNNTLNANQVTSTATNTGNNQANGNINQHGDAGAIQTGDASVNTVLGIQANTNETAISGSAGSATSNLNLINTGDNLKSHTGTSVDNSTTVTNNNQATINQDVVAAANTGNNQANRNIAYGGNAGTIQTGNATVNTGLSVNANQNKTSIAGDQGTATNNIHVLSTGNNSQILADTTTRNNTTVTNNNQANVNQVINTDANTGNNTTNSNIGGSAITTGNVRINNVAIANVNGNMTLVVNADAPTSSAFWNLFTSMFGQDLHGATVSVSGLLPQSRLNNTLTNTGDKVTVDLSQAQVHNINLSNNNNANVNQSAATNATTGNNNCDRTIGSCDVVTGSIDATNVFLVNVNSNLNFINNITFPGGVGGVETPVDPTGPTTPTQAPVELAHAPEVLAMAPQVLGASTTRATATQLPETGNNNALFGLLILASGLVLRAKYAKAMIKG
jgi:hypothetical protein